MVVLFDVLVLAAIAAGLLWGCGIPLAHLLLPRRLRPLLPLVAPFLGLALISALSHWIGALGGTLRHARWPVVAVVAAGWILLLADRRLRRFPRGSAPVLAVGLLAFLLAAVPLFRLGYLTTLGATVDGISYAVRSEYLQEAPPLRNNLSPGKPWLGWVMGQIELIRLGDVQLVGLLGLLTGRRSYELLTVVPALFFALTSGAVFVWARTGLRLSRRAALFAALLAGSHNLLLWPVYDNFLSQSLATSLIPMVLAFGVEGQRRPDWRTAALFGLLLSALVSIYPVYAAYTLAGLLAFWGVAWLLRPGRGRALGRAALWWLGAAACAAAWNGVALVRSARELGFVSQVLDPDRIQTAGTGNILVFPPVIEVLGLVAHADAAYGEGLGRNPLALLNVFGLGLAALALFGWWHLRPRVRTATAVLLLTGLALAAQQRWGINPPDGYPYGWYKSVSALAPQVVALLAAGFAVLWRYRSKRWLAALAGLLLLGINVRSSLWTQSYVLEVRVPEDRVSVDRELIEAAQAASRLDSPDDWLLLDLSSGLRPHWLGYLLRDYNVRYRDRLWIIHVETPGEAGAFCRYALIDLEERRGTVEAPWYDPESYLRLWGNGRYELRMRRDSTVASTYWGRRWPPGEAMVFGISGENGKPAKAAVSLGAEARKLSLGAGTPRTFQIRVFSAGTGARLAVQGIGAPVELPPGGWLVDLDLACAAGSGHFAISHMEGDALLADVQVLGSVTGQAGVCIETSPLPAGAAYVEQQILDGDRVRLDAVLLRPPGEQRVYRLSYHIGEEKGGQLGVWSLDFQAAGTPVQRATLELDLGDRSATGTVDGRPAAPETCCFEKEARSFEGGIAWWRLHPTEQVRVEPMLWFLRSGTGSVEVTRSIPIARLEILPAP